MRIAKLTTIALAASLTVGTAGIASAQGFAATHNHNGAQIIQVNHKDHHNKRERQRRHAAEANGNFSDHRGHDRRAERHHDRRDRHHDRRHRSHNDGIDSDTALGILGAAAILKSLN